MSRAGLGILLGLGAGAIDVLLMIPLKHPGKRTAMMGAFASRFAIGFLAANVDLPMAHLGAGAVVGLLGSIPDAIITKIYAPILVTGTIFGALACMLAHKWGI
jgi:hypothetical protein